MWGWGVGVRMKVGLAVWLRAPVGKWLVLVPRLRGGSSPHGSGRAGGPQLPRDQVRAEQGCDRGSACRRLARVTPLQGPEASFTALLHFRWHALWLQSIPCPPLPASSLGGQQRSGSCLEGEGAVLAAGRMALRGRGAWSRGQTLLRARGRELGRRHCNASLRIDGDSSDQDQAAPQSGKSQKQQDPWGEEEAGGGGH